jgi:hypothetical protein
MLKCVPQSVFSWNYVVAGATGGPAAVGLEVFGEQGSIYCQGTQYRICKHGWLSGHWTMESAGGAYAEAMKESALYRAFEVQDATALFELQAKNPFTRNYQVAIAGNFVGRIAPEGPFTRRTIIDCAAEVPEATQLFCFWLAALTWRRAARSSAEAAAAVAAS